MTTPQGTPRVPHIPLSPNRQNTGSRPPFPPTTPPNTPAQPATPPSTPAPYAPLGFAAAQGYTTPPPPPPVTLKRNTPHGVAVTIPLQSPTPPGHPGWDAVPLVVPRVPDVHLDRITAPNEKTWWPDVQAMLCSGTDTVRDIINDIYCCLPPQRIAVDIETHGTEGEGKWTITCITAAFRAGDGTVYSVLLNPLRSDEDRALFKTIVDRCVTMVFHNAPFDIPILYAHQLITFSDIRKVEDTLLLARQLRTISRGGRTLEELAGTYGIAVDTNVGVLNAFKAQNMTKEHGFASTDIDAPFYRRGAMSDTAVTLRLWDKLYVEVVNAHAKGQPGDEPCILTLPEAHELVAKVQRAGQVTLQVSATGLNWDADYMQSWLDKEERKVEEASAVLRNAGCDPGNGAHVVKLLDEQGVLPQNWPRTDKGALKADKKAMELLSKQNNPLADAHTIVAEHNKNANYMTSTRDTAKFTGRVHAGIQILGAHATGRMSVNDPPLQQFSEDARPVIVADDCDGDLWSVDWSSIEPVVLANMAGDVDFITSFNNGGDLYIPLARKAGLIGPEVSDEEADHHPGRKKAKRVLLAAMYGQGMKSLAEQMGITVDEAYDLQNGLRKSMHVTWDFMDSVKRLTERTGYSYTIWGRMMDEHMPDGEIKTHVAVNHFCQGSAADTLMDTLLRMDDNGAGHRIKMFIHDEMVVGERDVELTKQIMTTPPNALVQRAKINPLLRVDAQCMGRQWLKV